MPGLSKDLVLLILQFFEEEGFKDAGRALERDCGFYFNVEYFEEMILNGKWDEAERYLSGFTEFDDNKYSTKIYFEIRKQKFLEVLDKGDRAMALEILIKDLKVFAQYSEVLFKEMTELLTLQDIRDHDALSTYGDTKSARNIVMLELREIIEANPLFHGKLEFPNIQNQRLRRLINQSLNWQHIHCTYPQANPDVRTLFMDHVCPLSDNPLSSTSSDNNPQPSQTTSMQVTTSSTSPQSTQSTETNSTCSIGALFLDDLTKLATTNAVEDTTTVSQNEPIDTPDEGTSTITHPGPNAFNIPDEPNIIHPDENFSNIQESLPIMPLKNSMLENCGPISNADFPMVVAMILNEGSTPTSMDFHPGLQTALLVGTSVGDVGLWDISSGKKLLSRNFNVWDIEACSTRFKTALLKDPCVSVNCVAWSPNGCLFGVTYSKHIVQIYTYHVGNDIQQKLEVDAHVGGVNDLAFSIPEGQILVITCGDDKTVKVWDVTTGVKLYSFEGHDAPVYSVCPHSKSSIHFIFSISVDGNIKAWLYDNIGARVDYDAPGLGCTTMAYSADGTRLFSCGTSKCGDSFLVEWDENEGSIKRTYQGLQKNSLAVVQFDVMKNQFLAAGDEKLIKIWDINKVELLTAINAGGNLPANPLIRFNKDGTLLAVFANENGIKILATDFGFQLLHASDTCSVDAPGVVSDTFRKNGDPENLEGAKSKFTGKAKIQKDFRLFEVNVPSQCQTLWLPSNVKVDKISKLIYNNAGNAILVLAPNSILFWKWPCNDLNLSGKATTKISPQLWQPRNCSGLMANNMSDTNSEEVVPCFALSKNDSYLMSASGGKISLFNMMTFKKMLNIMPPPPATTCLAFYPRDNNIVAIGSDDSTIVIYNVRLAKIISKLKGHSKRVSGLAFSNALSILVSSAADAQICVWNTEGWEKQESNFLQIPGGKKSVALSDTFVQFHQDQTNILAVHGTLLAIYNAKNLECVKQWIPENVPPITSATFSCDGQMVFASFADGTISIFHALDLELCCRISSSAYLPPSASYDVHPVAVTAHPEKPNQFAVGLTDGRILVLEPANSTGKWSMLPSYENGLQSKIPAESDY